MRSDLTENLIVLMIVEVVALTCSRLRLHLAARGDLSQTEESDFAASKFFLIRPLITQKRTEGYSPSSGFVPVPSANEDDTLCGKDDKLP